ncbi:MAG: PA0069 family radical SAM protein [Pseudomonadota bacterium]
MASTNVHEAAPDPLHEERNEADALRTDVTIERPRKIITTNTSPYVGFDRSINPYRGCEHGCIYCFARPTHAYMGLSPGLDFEARLFAKPSAAKLLANELSHPRYKPRAVAIGTNTDPYQPIEKRFRIMRDILSVFDAFSHPVTVLTKGRLITRDSDIFARLAARNLTRTALSITTQDKALARAMEPRASTPERRFAAVRELAAAGAPVGVVIGPLIPGLNDSELEAIMERAADHGASYSAYTILRLPLEVSPLFQEWLEEFAPARAKRIMRHIRDMNGGRDYDPEWSRNREIRTPYATMIAKRYAAAARRLGLGGKPAPLDLTQFHPPPSATPQLSLF